MHPHSEYLSDVVHDTLKALWSSTAQQQGVPDQKTCQKDTGLALINILLREKQGVTVSCLVGQNFVDNLALTNH